MIYRVIEFAQLSILIWFVVFIPMVVWYELRLRDGAAAARTRLGQMPKRLVTETEVRLAESRIAFGMHPFGVRRLVTALDLR